jgi:adhesin/invasin
LDSLGGAVESFIPGDGDKEVNFLTQDNYDLRYSILAVMPIAFNPYSQLSNEHLYFTQLRLGNHEPYANGDDRVLLNAGLGFRTLINGNNAILGANVFYDREFEQSHERGSVGIEYLANNFEVYANIYDSLSERATYTHGSSTITEDVLDGFDYSLVGQLPYMPWAKAVYKGYKWNQSGSDLEGYNIGLEAQLARGLVVIYGRNKPDNLTAEDFFELTFKWPSNHLTPTLVTHTVTEYAFPVKNMKNEMLHKVRRTNNIITEKNMGGVVVARGT